MTVLKNEFSLCDDNDEFIRFVYWKILGREPDNEGFRFYLDRLNQGMPRFRFILELACSPEAKFRGFDATEIEDVISFYLRYKKKIIHSNLNRKIAEKYADRIYGFIYKLGRAHLHTCDKVVATTDSSAQSQAKDVVQGEENVYKYTRDQAESILYKINIDRLTSYRGSITDEALGIYVPQWEGVKNATKNFFQYTFPIPLTSDINQENLNQDQINAISDALAECSFQQLIFSAGSYSQFLVAKFVKEKNPTKRIKLIWHGSPLQLGPYYELDPFIAWVSSTRKGVCDVIGTVKPGMTSLFNALGIRTYYLQNSIDDSTVTKKIQDGSNNTVGMWLSHVGNFRKPVAPTLLALARLPHFTLKGAGFGDDGIKLIQELGIPHKYISPSTVPNSRVRDEMRTSIMTAYITLSECMPIVPLESIAEGTLCLVGPATRLYDDPLLEEHLVVRNPFDAIEIARKIEGVMNRYDRLLDASVEFLKRTREHSQKSIIEFLDY